MSWEKAVRSWETLGRVTGKPLREARLPAHWAVQPVAWFGMTFVPSRPDDSHTSLTWLPGPRLLASEPLGSGARAAVRLADLTLLLLDDRGSVEDQLPLPGRTLDEAKRWILEKGINSGGGRAAELKPPAYEIPGHPAGAGEPFRLGSPEPYRELERWYANAAALEEIVAAKWVGASPVRCWPHHFDLATLISAEGGGADPEEARSIGVGMTPGDDYYDVPYFYVNPWPRRAGTDLPALAGGGIWHTEDWFGAVLPAGALLASGGSGSQPERVTKYLESALLSGKSLLGL